jgi:hypothetical protein
MKFRKTFLIATLVLLPIGILIQYGVAAWGHECVNPIDAISHMFALMLFCGLGYKELWRPHVPKKNNQDFEKDN